MALLQVVGLASIVPFLSVVADRGMIEENQILNWLFEFLGFKSEDSFLLFLGFVVMGILVLSNATSAVVIWAVERFSWMRNHALSRRLLASYLSRPYEFFLNENTATLGRNILSETHYVISGLVIPIVEMLANLALVVFIIIFLVLIDPILAAIIIAAIGCSFAIIYRLVRRKLAKLGEQKVEANRNRFKTANEAFGDFKLVKLLNAKDYFMKNYSEQSFVFSDRVATANVISKVPRYALETVAFGGLLLIVLYLIATQGDMYQVLPLIGLYAFAGYRLMPALQMIFHSASRVRFHLASLDVIYEALEGSHRGNAERVSTKISQDPITFKETIELERIAFRYPGSADAVISDLSLSIKANSSIAFVGKTGSGKTTIADIILGLLTPQEGVLRVDGKEITQNNVRQWQRNLGYVPQEIYLLDDTVSQNIAFAQPKEEIDMKAVECSAKMASIHDFIVEELPLGYDTVVGERGIRLSGGERQRIGIARALYRDPLVVVFDEATSALDASTERSVLEAIRNIARAKTLVLIAHRLTTVRKCDTVYVVDQGKIIAQGTYDDLLESCAVFRDWAKKHE